MGCNLKVEGAAKRDLLVKGVIWYCGVLDNTKSWNFEFILINIVGALCTGSFTLLKYLKRKKMFSNGKTQHDLLLM